MLSFIQIHGGSESNLKVGSGSTKNHSESTSLEMQKKLGEKLIFVDTLKAIAKKRRIRIRNPVY